MLRVAGGGLEISAILWVDIVGRGRYIRKERAIGVVFEAVVKNILVKVLSGVFVLIHRMSA